MIRAHTLILILVAVLVLSACVTQVAPASNAFTPDFAATPLSGGLASLSEAATPVLVTLKAKPTSTPALPTRALTVTSVPAPVPPKPLPPTPEVEATAEVTPTATSTSTLTSTPTATPDLAVVTLTTNANLRAGPGTHYPVVAGGRLGQVLPVVGQYAGWYEVTLPNNRKIVWVSGTVAQPNALARQAPVSTAIPPAPATPTPAPVVVEPPPAAVSPAPASAGSVAGLPPYQDVVVLGPATVYPVRAQVVQGWGYELVDASTQYDWLINRDVYGAVARQFWGDTLYGRHPAGIRITLLDVVYEPGCAGYCMPQASVALWNLGRGDYRLGLGYGDGAGSMIYTDCALAHAVFYDPQECFIAVAADGPYLTDVVVSTVIVAHNATMSMMNSWTPDFTQAPFTPLLGQASYNAGQWRWADPFLRVVQVQ